VILPLVRRIRAGLRREALRPINLTWSFAAFGIIPFASLALFWIRYPASPGYAIGVLAFAAVVMTARAPFSNTERTAWLLIAACLLIAELRGIYKDREEFSQDERYARFREGLLFSNVLKQSKEGFSKATVDLGALIDSNRKLSDLSLKTVYEITGGDAFCFMTPSGDGKVLSLYNPGNYPLTNLTIDISDYIHHIDDHVTLPIFPPRTIQPSKYSLAAGDQYNFGILFHAINGAWAETLQLRKINGIWAKAIKVQIFPTKANRYGKVSLKTKVYQVDSLYPRQSGKVEWCKWMFEPAEQPSSTPCTLR
jgi:hypothetical protein